MTQKSTASLQADVNQYIVSSCEEEITAAILNQILVDIIVSCYNKTSDTAAINALIDARLSTVVSDTSTVNMSISGAGNTSSPYNISGDIIISATSGNILSNNSGAYVPPSVLQDVVYYEVTPTDISNGYADIIVGDADYDVNKFLLFYKGIAMNPGEDYEDFDPSTGRLTFGSAGEKVTELLADKDIISVLNLNILY